MQVASYANYRKPAMRHDRRSRVEPSESIAEAVQDDVGVAVVIGHNPVPVESGVEVVDNAETHGQRHHLGESAAGGGSVFVDGTV